VDGKGYARRSWFHSQEVRPSDGLRCRRVVAPLPPIPKVELEVIQDQSEERHGFLEVRRFDMVAIRGGERSKPFRYDLLERRALDACVMVAHHLDSTGSVFVYLRSAVRPPIAFRPREPHPSAVLWEVPAGLIEPDESPRAAAARELAEELGFALPEERFERLGEWSVPAPGFIGEVHHYFHVRVDPQTIREPDGDGSPLEDGALIVSVPLEAGLAACKDGTIRDAKTEIALRRLADTLTKG
jgi:ADP-ribose pyrophosphatase